MPLLFKLLQKVLTVMESVIYLDTYDDASNRIVDGGMNSWFRVEFAVPVLLFTRALSSYTEWLGQCRDTFAYSMSCFLLLVSSTNSRDTKVLKVILLLVSLFQMYTAMMVDSTRFCSSTHPFTRWPRSLLILSTDTPIPIRLFRTIV